MGERTRRATSVSRTPLYVEATIRASLDRVWKLSQDPESHPRWDLRFSRITLIEADDDGFVRFRYEFYLPLHIIRGTGTSLGNRVRSDGQATSVLKFDTNDPISPIGQGSGYWRYIPTEDGIRFITGYNYQPGMGALGKVLDSWLIRPALGWATAVSFDRLRLWAETGLAPSDARNRWLLDTTARATGFLTACVLLRNALAERSAGTAALALTGALVTLLAPPHSTVPRAARCLRKAPDPRSARAPSALEDLPEPATREQSADRGER
ncbi:SRPBCC family protein [Arthrobacter sp. TMT4-20]